MKSRIPKGLEHQNSRFKQSSQTAAKKRSNLRAGYRSIPALEIPRTLEEMTEIAAEHLGDEAEGEDSAGE